MRYFMLFCFVFVFWQDYKPSSGSDIGFANIHTYREDSERFSGDILKITEGTLIYAFEGKYKIESSFNNTEFDFLMEQRRVGNLLIQDIRYYNQKEYKIERDSFLIIDTRIYQQKKMSGPMTLHPKEFKFVYTTLVLFPNLSFDPNTYFCFDHGKIKLEKSSQKTEVEKSEKVHVNKPSIEYIYHFFEKYSWYSNATFVIDDPKNVTTISAEISESMILGFHINKVERLELCRK
jgi:hypothetical protein